MVDLPEAVGFASTSLSMRHDHPHGPRFHAVLLPLLLVLLVVPPEAFVRFSKEASRLQAFALIDGTKQPVRVGTIIAEGRLIGEGEDQYCDLPATSYGLAGSSSGQASLILEVTSDCRLVVSAIEVAPSVATDSGSGSMKTYAADADGERSFETGGTDDE